MCWNHKRPRNGIIEVHSRQIVLSSTVRNSLKKWTEGFFEKLRPDSTIVDEVVSGFSQDQTLTIAQSCAEEY